MLPEIESIRQGHKMGRVGRVGQITTHREGSRFHPDHFEIHRGVKVDIVVGLGGFVNVCDDDGNVLFGIKRSVTSPDYNLVFIIRVRVAGYFKVRQFKEKQFTRGRVYGEFEESAPPEIEYATAEPSGSLATTVVAFSSFSEIEAKNELAPPPEEKTG